MSNQDLFGQTYTEILSKVVGGGAKDNFQLIYPFIPWWWSPAPSGQMSQPVFSLVNSIPQYSALGQYSPTDGTVDSMYREVLANVNVTVSPAKQQQLRDARDQLTTAQTARANDETARNIAYITMKNNTPAGIPVPEFAQWAIDSGWTATLQKDLDAITKAQETMGSIVGQENPEYQRALAGITAPSDISTKKNGWTLMNQGDGNLVPRPMWSVGTTGQDWINLLSKGSEPRTIQLDAAKSSQALSQSWAGADASYGNPFWGIQASGDWNKFDLSTEDSSVTVTITLKGTTTVSVNPSTDWYDNGFLAKLARDPNAFNDPFKPTGGPSPVFGKGGLLPLRITGLVAAYQPGFTISMSSATFDRHREEFRASTGLRIGPFTFGGSGGHITDNWNRSAEGSTFSGQSNATYPVIIGVLVAGPGGVTA